jgi:hypothetical protein
MLPSSWYLRKLVTIFEITCRHNSEDRNFVFVSSLYIKNLRLFDSKKVKHKITRIFGNDFTFEANSVA